MNLSARRWAAASVPVGFCRPRIQFPQSRKYALYIRGIGGMDHVQIEGVDRRALQNRGHADNDQEVYLMVKQRPQDGEGPIGWRLQP